MSLTTLAYNTNPYSYVRDSVLLSTLPYCVAKYKSLRVLFSDGPSYSSCITKLVADGLVEKKDLLIKSKFRSYKVRYIGLTTAGLEYLCSKYAEAIPWLVYVKSIMDSTPSYRIQRRGPKNNDGINLLLQLQSGNLFWSMAGADTIYERMLRPDQLRIIAAAISVKGQTPKSYTPNLFADAMLLYLDAEFGNPSNVSSERVPLLSAGDEVRVPAYYSRPEVVAREAMYGQRDSTMTGAHVEKKDYGTIANNHIGILRGTYNDYVVYATQRHGIVWNPGAIKLNSVRLHNQFVAIGSTRFDSAPANGYSSILICTNAAEFRFAFTDTRHQRPSRAISFGTGAFSLHMIPFNDDGLSLADAIINTPRYDAETINAALESISNVSRSTQYPQCPIACMGNPCISGFALDGRMLTECRSLTKKVEDTGTGNPPGVICWEWQAPFIRSILPGTRIFYIADQAEFVQEYLD